MLFNKLSQELTLLSEDYVWPFLLVQEGPTCPSADWDRLIPLALDNGRAAAELVRKRYPGLTPSSISAAQGIPVHSSRERSNDRWIKLRATYQKRPLKITIYQSGLDSLTELAQKYHIHRLNSKELVFEVMLAHELYHHFQPQFLPNSKYQYRTVWFRLGSWEIHRPLNVLHEIAAHFFARHLCDLNVAPAVLDLLDGSSNHCQIYDLLKQARAIPFDSPNNERF